MARLSLTPTVVVLVGSVCVNGLLIWRVHSLRETVKYLTEDRVLAVNAKAPPIIARDLGGKTAVVDYTSSGKATVLYVFTPTCSWCRRNLRNLKELAKGVSERYTFVGVSLAREGLSEYVSSTALPIRVIADLPPSTVMDYRLSGTPQTIVVSSSGRVLKNWRGAYGGQVKAEVEGFFGVRLPDDVGAGP